MLVDRARLLGYILQSSAYRRIATGFMSGKEHPRIGPEVLRRLRVPVLALDAQDRLVARLVELDNEAKDLLARLSKTTDIPCRGDSSVRAGHCTGEMGMEG